MALIFTDHFGFFQDQLAELEGKGQVRFNIFSSEETRSSVHYRVVKVSSHFDLAGNSGQDGIDRGSCVKDINYLDLMQGTSS